jgi:hypothetical protein
MAASLDPSSFFERGRQGRLPLRVPGTGLLSGQIKALEQAAHAPDAVAHAVDLLGTRADVHHPPGAHPVPLRVGTAPRGPHAACSVGRARPRPSALPAALRSAPPGGPSAGGRADLQVLPHCSAARHRATPAAPYRPALQRRPGTSPPAPPGQAGGQAMAIANRRIEARRSGSKRARRRSSPGDRSRRMARAGMAMVLLTPERHSSASSATHRFELR